MFFKLDFIRKILVLDTIENCSFNRFQSSLELVLPMAHVIATEDNVTVMSCMTTLSCIFHTKALSQSMVEGELCTFVSHSSVEVDIRQG